MDRILNYKFPVTLLLVWDMECYVKLRNMLPFHKPTSVDYVSKLQRRDIFTLLLFFQRYDILSEKGLNPNSKEMSGCLYVVTLTRIVEASKDRK